MSFDAHNSSTLVMVDNEGTTRLDLGLDPTGTLRLGLNYKNSRRMVGIDARNDSPRILIMNKSGKTLWKAPKEKQYQDLR